MKNILMLFMALALTSTTVIAQASEDTMKDRAEKLHQVLKTKDIAVHKKFVNENYSKKFLDKVEMSRHTGMIGRLNQDFSDSKVISMKVKEDKLLMLIERNSDKHHVTFDISYDPKDNYKINGMGIEAGEM
ncbi:hypothetical protein [Xanthomarina gelatinilytica]|uniref:hypothetical protein n=1 Tax=Xanthomarina gelatinilytica TaxID=1137281 RepID=UPI003AA826DC